MFGRWPDLLVFKRTLCDFLLVAMVLAVFLEASVLAETSKSFDENPQLDNEYSKRGWKNDLPMWGKRGWNSLHSSWGKRDAELDDDLNGFVNDKRAWQKLQGGWGKRFIPSEDDLLIRQLAAALDEEDNNVSNVEYLPEQDLNVSHEMTKRNWRSFSDGWGKRSNKWDKFRGSWGKRQPAWHSLKGLWGKRSSTTE